MTTTDTDQRTQRRRSGLTLAGIAVAALALLVTIAAIVLTRLEPVPEPAPSVPTSAPTIRALPPPANEAAAELRELATRPMLELPAQAAQPQAMTTQTAGPDIDVPDPESTGRQWIPGGFPRTGEGALAQLKALNETALSAADPAVYSRAYREMSLPGAPNPGGTGLVTLLSSLRSRAGLPATGPVNGMSASYQVNHGQIKGIAAGGNYAVVCTLGQFSLNYQGQVITAGVGDCQALHWTGVSWRIAAGALAAAAPSAWPGSADMVKAGYRGLR
ncbi:hypothetical protein [Amycolatopsis magusensis]|uniref:hypothetical protein n=1 Tax=Amycolatopsis magusensis TaxID=882444 RepID=UPI0037B3BBAE